MVLAMMVVNVFGLIVKQLCADQSIGGGVAASDGIHDQLPGSKQGGSHQLGQRRIRDGMVLHRVALVCASTVWVIFTGPARPEAGQVTNSDYGCTYSSKTKGDVLHVDHCAWSDAAGHIHLKREQRLALDFDRHGLASVNIGGGWYYVSQDGRLAPVMTMDNWAEPFAGGLARSPVGNKIGFINCNLAVVIPPRYDGALPFEDGRAEVCIDCKLTSHGEHSSYEGGRWSCIDRRGRVRKPFSPGLSAGHVCRN
jgi:WG containing repeat